MRKKGCIFKIRTWGVLEGAILSLLIKHPSHGYLLVEQIAEFGISPQVLNQGVIYRILNKLESNGFINSEWETEGGGAARKIYNITETGKTFLKDYIKTEKKKIKLLNKIISKIEDILNNEE